MITDGLALIVAVGATGGVVVFTVTVTVFVMLPALFVAVRV